MSYRRATEFTRSDAPISFSVPFEAARSAPARAPLVPSAAAAPPSLLLLDDGQIPAAAKDLDAVRAAALAAEPLYGEDEALAAADTQPPPPATPVTADHVPPAPEDVGEDPLALLAEYDAGSPTRHAERQPVRPATGLAAGDDDAGVPDRPEDPSPTPAEDPPWRTGGFQANPLPPDEFDQGDLVEPTHRGDEEPTGPEVRERPGAAPEQSPPPPREADTVAPLRVDSTAAPEAPAPPKGMGRFNRRNIGPLLLVGGGGLLVLLLGLAMLGGAPEPLPAPAPVTETVPPPLAGSPPPAAQEQGPAASLTRLEIEELVDTSLREAIDRANERAEKVLTDLVAAVNTQLTQFGDRIAAVEARLDQTEQLLADAIGAGTQADSDVAMDLRGALEDLASLKSELARLKKLYETVGTPSVAEGAAAAPLQTVIGGKGKALASLSGLSGRNLAPGQWVEGYGQILEIRPAASGGYLVDTENATIWIPE